MKTLVIYDTKYGSTKEIAQAIGTGLGGQVSWVKEIKEVNSYDLIVLGCPIYAGRLLPGMIDFLEREKENLVKSRLAIFIVCGDTGSIQVQGQETGGKAYLRELSIFLKGGIVATEAFLGRMKKAEIDQEDQNMLEEFSNILGVNFPDFDGVDLHKAKEFGQDLKEKLVRLG